MKQPSVAKMIRQITSNYTLTIRTDYDQITARVFWTVRAKERWNDVGREIGFRFGNLIPANEWMQPEAEGEILDEQFARGLKSMLDTWVSPQGILTEDDIERVEDKYGRVKTNGKTREN